MTSRESTEPAISEPTAIVATTNQSSGAFTGDSGDAQLIAGSMDQTATGSTDTRSAPLDTNVKNAGHSAHPVPRKKTSLSFTEAIFSGNVDGLTRQARTTVMSEIPHEDERDINTLAVAETPAADTVTPSKSEDVALSETVLAVSDASPSSIRIVAGPQRAPDREVPILANGVGTDIGLTHGDEVYPSMDLPGESRETDYPDLPTSGINTNGTAEPPILARTRPESGKAANDVTLGDVESRTISSSVQLASITNIDTQTEVGDDAETVAGIGGVAPPQVAEVLSTDKSEPSIYSGLTCPPGPELDEGSTHGKSLESTGVFGVEATGKNLGAAGGKRVGFASPLGTVVLLERSARSDGATFVGVEELSGSRDAESFSRDFAPVGRALTASSSLSPSLPSPRPANMSGAPFMMHGLLHCPYPTLVPLCRYLSV